MALTVRDVMNPQLLYVDEDDPLDLARSKILGFGVSGVPVLDRSFRAIGFVSLRDFSADGKTARVTRPAVTVRPDESVADAARRLVERNLRHLVVVDEHGVTKGVLSALDLVRALSGLEPRHPARFDDDCTSAAAFPDDDARAR